MVRLLRLIRKSERRMRRRGLVRAQEKKKVAALAEPAAGGHSVAATPSNGAGAMVASGPRPRPADGQPTMPRVGMPPGPRTQPGGPVTAPHSVHARRDSGPLRRTPPAGLPPGSQPVAPQSGYGLPGAMGPAAHGSTTQHPGARAPIPHSGPVHNLPTAEGRQMAAPPSQPMTRTPPPQPTVRVLNLAEPSLPRPTGPLPNTQQPGQMVGDPFSALGSSSVASEPPPSPTRPTARRVTAAATRLSPAVEASLARLAGKSDAPSSASSRTRDRERSDSDPAPDSGGGVKAAE